MALKNNTWKLNQWYDQNVAGNATYSGAGELWVWGSNEYYGPLGQNNRTAYSSPVQVPGTTWKNVTMFGGVSDGRSFVTKTDGTLWAWGHNDQGCLGLNDIVNYSSPVQIPGTTWKQPTTGYEGTTAATKTDGTLWVWGKGGYGQLGLNQNAPTVKFSSPVQLPGTTWSFVVDGGVARKAIKTDGTLWAWGHNGSGGLGQGNNTQYSSPVQIGSDTTWSTIAPNTNYGQLATKTDGTLWAWGWNNTGGLGQNNRTEYNSPVQVGSGTDWSTGRGKVASSSSSGFAIKTDGTLYAVGAGSGGELAQNNLTAYSSPVQIPGTTWANVYSSSTWVLATKTDGTLWGWGDNEAGELGLNNTTRYSSPVQIPGDWNSPGSAISCSTSHNLVVKQL